MSDLFTCEGCGAETPRRQRNQRFCSIGCFSKATRRNGREVACAICGALVYKPASELDRASHHFCSTDHANEWQARTKVTNTCKTCGREFRVSPSRIARGDKITYCGLPCRDADPDRTAMLRRLNLRQQMRAPSSLERAGYALLTAMGCDYLPQHQIDERFVVDAFVPSTSTVIEFDGDYWHGHPTRFPDPDARQCRRMALDVTQDAYMVAKGFAVIRVWESDLKVRPAEVEAMLRERLGL